MRKTTLPVVLFALLAGCAAATGAGSGLANSDWRFVTIDGTAPVSERAQLKFEGDNIAAHAGCNGMGGNWRVRDGRLIAGPLTQTEMYCEGPVWGQEQAIGALLTSAPELKLSGERMVLKSSGHSAVLRRVK